MSYTVVWRILIDFLLYPYHIHTRKSLVDPTICGRMKTPMPSQKRPISTNFLLMFGPVLLVIIL
nr:unnamed protein product [Callosobruchus chinensis]